MKRGIYSYQKIYDENNKEKEGFNREELIKRYIPLVKYIADRMAIRLPSHVSKDDLIGAGIMGLLDAVDRYDQNKKESFRSYVEQRIRGAMLDELRRMDWVPRSVRKEIQKVEEVTLNLWTKKGKMPDNTEIAKAMGMDLDSFYKLLDKAKGINLISLDDTLPDGKTPIYTQIPSDEKSAFDLLRLKDLKKILKDLIKQLSPKEQMVISLYYFEELTLKEIAKVMNLTESRISQLHSSAIMKLRVKLKKAGLDLY